MENKKVTRVLNVLPSMRAAGVESFVMNVYRNIDRSKIQFDFLVHTNKKEFFDDEIKKLGGRIYRLSLKDDKNFVKYIRDLNNFFKEHPEYTIVHGHMQSLMPLYLAVAKKNGVKERIAHSHNSSFEKSTKGVLLHIFSRFAKYFSTTNYACSKTAGQYLFGKNKFEVILNGIDVDKFFFNEENRKKLRKELLCEDKFVIGHIARFELQKNHEFLVDVFYEFQKKCRDSVLLLVGEGKLENRIKRQVDLLGISDKVHFLGVRKDANVLYSAFDCFVLPSLYEGLPVVGVESQLSGLPVLLSDTITNEVYINFKTKFLDISSRDCWIDSLSEQYLYFKKSSSANCRMVKNYEKFDIKNIADNLENRYEQKSKN